MGSRQYQWVGSPRTGVSCGLLIACLAAAEWRGSKAGPQQADEGGRLRTPAASSAHAGIRCVISRSQVYKSGRNCWPAAQAGKAGKRRGTKEGYQWRGLRDDQVQKSVAEATLAGRNLERVSYHSFDGLTNNKPFQLPSGKIHSQMCYCVGHRRYNNNGREKNRRQKALLAE